MSLKPPEVLVTWEETALMLFERTQGFPKKDRFVFAQRMEGLALDVLEGLQAARYAARADKADVLRGVDGALARLRILVRMAHRRRLLSNAAYEQLSRRTELTGRQVGGWRKIL